MLLDPKAERTLGEVLRRRRLTRPARQLLAAVLDLAGPRAELLSHVEQPWASVTFAGARHTVTLAFIGDDAIEAGEAFAEALPEHEFEIEGQLVADAAIMAIEHTMLPGAKLTVEAELLLLEDV